MKVCVTTIPDSPWIGETIAITPEHNHVVRHSEGNLVIVPVTDIEILDEETE